jgi:large subunit ribosomal protein L5
MASKQSVTKTINADAKNSQKSKSPLAEKYQKEISNSLASEFNIINQMSVPRVTKVVVNTGIGEAIKNKELIESTARDLAVITGLKPSVRRAKVSVATFGVRSGMPVGLKVTLRRDKMYDFLLKLFSVVLPRLRDFRGLPKKSIDKNGNYTFGIVEHTVFPEIDLTKVTKPFGMEITLVTNTKNKDIAERLLVLMGLPFEK